MGAERPQQFGVDLIASVVALVFLLPSFAPAEGTPTLTNRELTVLVHPQDGTFELRAEGLLEAVLVARAGAEVNHAWIWSTDYPNRHIVSSTFETVLGLGHQMEVTFSGLKGKPDLKYSLQLYDALPFGNCQIQIQNTGVERVTVQDIRILDVIGQSRINLGGPDNADRVLSDSFSEDRPPLRIYDLGKAPTYLGGDALGQDLSDMHLGVGSQLIYNQQSGFGLFLAALTSERWLTLLHLKTDHSAPGAIRVAAYTVDSAGTTEILKKESLRDDPAADQIELSLPVAPESEISSEKLLFAVGRDYHAQLENYGKAIRVLHHARVSGPSPWGWWSWTAYYYGLSQGFALSNAQWLSEHLKDLGFDFLHVDEGYAYADGEYTTSNATLFPDGMRNLGHDVQRLGLKFGVWVAPFRVSGRSSVYENHPEWLVHNAERKPIQIGFIDDARRDPIFVLDTTHPGAQSYLRRTYETLTREWGVRYFKLDFMDDTAIEGYHYRPNTTALEAQRIGLQIIREAVGNDVLLDKDGSPMLNPVGLVDQGRMSTDTGHSFQASKEDASGIAARYYMNQNFFIADPDAFTVAKQLIPDQSWHQSQVPLTLDEAEVSITLAAIAGGMFEIGDDLPTLGAEPERLALVKNNDLLQMLRLARAATPLDLMTYAPEDE